LENALENVTRALNLLPPNADRNSLILRSRLLTQRGSIEWALVAWQKPNARKTFRNLALDDLNKASQLDPDNLRAAFLLRQTATLQETP